MSRLIRTRIALAVIALGTLCSVPAVSAQRASAPPVPEPPEVPTYTVEQDVRRYGDDVVRIGQDYVLGSETTVGEVVVIMGNARLEGRALQDVTVVFGDVELGSTAVVRSLSVVGGRTTIQSGARIERDVLTVGGTFQAPPGFSAGGEQVIIGSNVLGERFQAVKLWITRGLLWGRPIVPGLWWMWPIIGAFFLIYLIVNAVFNRPVRNIALTLSSRPLTSFVAGVIVVVLTGPFVLLLAVSLVGLLIVPIVVCTLIVAVVIGKVGVMRSIGMAVVPEGETYSPLGATRSYVLGFSALAVAYMVPVLGFATLALAGVIGLGGTAISFLGAYRRENPEPPRVPQTPPPTAPPTSFQRPLPAGGPMETLESTSLASEVRPADDRVPTPPAVPVTSGGSAVAVADLLIFPHAMFLDRLAAFVLDFLLVMISWQILSPLRRPFGGDGMFLMLFAYHVGFWTWKGTTVGGIICQLRLVRIDGGPLQFVDAFVRGLSAIFSLAVLGLGGLWILKDPDRQAWHDRIAGTFVVKVPRNWPI